MSPCLKLKLVLSSVVKDQIQEEKALFEGQPESSSGWNSRPDHELDKSKSAQRRDNRNATNGHEASAIGLGERLDFELVRLARRQRSAASRSRSRDCQGKLVMLLDSRIPEMHTCTTSRGRWLDDRDWKEMICKG